MNHFIISVKTRAYDLVKSLYHDLTLFVKWQGLAGWSLGHLLVLTFFTTHAEPLIYKASCAGWVWFGLIFLNHDTASFIYFTPMYLGVYAVLDPFRPWGMQSE